jgi:hypothetical protein
MSLHALGQSHQRGAAAAYGSLLLKTGQTTQYNSELDDGYYEMGVAKSYTVNTSGAQSGTSNVDLTHLVSDTGAFTAGDKTYTDAGKCGVFKAAGGETVVISGSANNNGVFTTVSATADTVVFLEAITDEADAPETTFKKREAISNNTVLDNNTGLTWTRYQETKFGALGLGYVPWTGKVYDVFAYCAAANAASLGGYTDWRVPNYYEIRTLADFEAPNGYVDSTAFPDSGNFTVWTSTTRMNGTTAAYVCQFAGQAAYGDVKTSESYSAPYLVRGG